MSRLWPYLLALTVVVVGPILLRPKGDDAVLKGQDHVVVISPHNEASRAEFSHGFREWYQQKTGRTVVVDFRTPGGTSEIMRFLTGAYNAAFEGYWKKTTGEAWTSEAEAGWINSKLDSAKATDPPTVARKARELFLKSDVGSGIDVFFGGGSFDFQKAAYQGLLVDCGYVARHPERFGREIPQFVGGEPYFDPKGRWMGTAIGAFGIAYNRDQIKRHGIPEPRKWADLADPRYYRGIALANPTQTVNGWQVPYTTPSSGTGASLTYVIPEPSAALLGIAGALGLIRRRR